MDKLNAIRRIIPRGIRKAIKDLTGISASADCNAPIFLWDEDEKFNDVISEIVAHTIVDKIRCYMLYQFSKQVSSLQGDAAEVGVYKGGTARLMARTFAPKGKTVHLFDTFSGLPPCDPEKDCHNEGDFCDVSLETVKDYLHDCKNVLFYPGIFPNTSKPLENKTFCLVHIDADIYESLLSSLDFFYPRMVQGGIIIFDDYGFPSCPGARLAVDEFFMDKQESPCYMPTGQCFIIRL